MAASTPRLRNTFLKNDVINSYSERKRYVYRLSMHPPFPFLVGLHLITFMPFRSLWNAKSTTNIGNPSAGFSSISGNSHWPVTQQPRLVEAKPRASPRLFLIFRKSDIYFPDIFSKDPTFILALREFRTLLERFANGTSMGFVVDAAKALVEATHCHPALMAWFEAVDRSIIDVCFSLFIFTVLNDK